MHTESDLIKFIESVFGACAHSSNGQNIAIRCPFCDSKSPDKKKLTIRLSDQANHCWVCEFKARSLIPLLIKFGSSDDLNTYRTRFYQGKFFDVVGAKQLSKLSLPSDFKLLSFPTDHDARVLRRYAASRGLTDDDVLRFCLGFSTHREFFRRMIIPSFDRYGELNFYTARSIDDSQMKYVNADVKKTEIIFNEMRVDWTTRLTIVEGPLDMIKCNENSTCLLGNQLDETTALFDSLIANKTPVALCLDDDMQKRTIKFANKLSSYGIDVTVVDLDGAHDPGELSKDQFAERLEKAHSWSWQKSISNKLDLAMKKRFII